MKHVLLQQNQLEQVVETLYRVSRKQGNGFQPLRTCPTEQDEQKSIFGLVTGLTFLMLCSN